MPRYKLGPQGAYLDQNDSGPDQASPEQIAALQGGQSQPSPAAPGAGPNQDMPSGSAPTEEPASQYSINPDLMSGVGSRKTQPYTPNLEDQMIGMSDQQYGGGVTGKGSVSASQLSADGAAPSPYTTQATAPTVDESTGQPTTPAPTPGATPPPAPTAQAAGPVGAVPPGFDATKWNDSNKSDPKYDVGHYVQAHPNATSAEIQQMLDAKYPGKYKAQGSDSVVETATGDIYDFRNGTTGLAQWTGVGNINDSGGGGSSAGGGDNKIQGFPSGGAGGAGGGGSMSNPFGGGPMGDAIARLLGRGEAGVNANDPNILGPTAAFRAQAENATRQSRSALAERSAAEGTNPGGAGSGAFDSAIQSQIEQQGRNVGSFQATQMTNEIAAQRQDVMNALQLAQGEEKIYLEQYLAQLNDQLQRAQMGQQNQQWYDQFAYNQGKDAYDRSADYYGGISK